MKVFVFHLLVYSGLLTCSGLAERNGNLNQAMLVRAGRSSNDESRSRYAQNESFSDNLFVGAGSESQDSEPAVIDISSRADEAPKDDGGDKRFIVPSESDVLSVQSLRYKLETNAPPFFDFRSDVDRLLDALINPSDDIIPASEFEVENVVNQYLSILRDMYYVQFAQLCANSGHNYKLCRHHIDSILKECTAAMAAALPTPTPNGRVWSYQGYFSELEADLARHLAEIAAINEAQGFPTETYLEEQPGAIWRKIRTSKWFKRCKWLAAQSLVLAVNIGQFELQRMLSRRAAEKRLAAVPEFPLL